MKHISWRQEGPGVAHIAVSIKIENVQVNRGYGAFPLCLSHSWFSYMGNEMNTAFAWTTYHNPIITLIQARSHSYASVCCVRRKTKKITIVLL